MSDPRIRPRTKHEVSEEVGTIYEAFVAERGVVPNMFRTAAGRPAHLRSLIGHFRDVMGQGTVPRLLKELLAIRVSSLNHCLYCLASHSGGARNLGAPENWILAVRPEEPEHGAAGTGSLDDMERGWIVALRYAELVNESGHAVTDEIYAKLAQHWDEGAIVEITAVIGLFAYFNRFNDALRVEVTPLPAARETS